MVNNYLHFSANTTIYKQLFTFWYNYINCKQYFADKELKQIDNCSLKNKDID